MQFFEKILINWKR